MLNLTWFQKLRSVAKCGNISGYKIVCQGELINLPAKPIDNL